MSKTQLLNRYTKDSEQRSFFAQALDKMAQAEQRQSQETTGFFTPEEQVDFMSLLQAYGGGAWAREGGYDQAERRVFVFLPPWMEELSPEDVPLSVIQASYGGEVGHRDVLGSLMSLGLTRRKLGDIVLGEGMCQVLCLAETAPILLSQWSSIGRYPISLVEKPLGDLVQVEEKTKEIHSTVASLRLDSMVATGFSLSRSKAQSLIQGGRVAVNHRECSKGDKLVEEGDLLTCRGLGKCQVVTVGGQSRKGRYLITLMRYL